MWAWLKRAWGGGCADQTQNVTLTPPSLGGSAGSLHQQQDRTPLPLVHAQSASSISSTGSAHADGCVRFAHQQHADTPDVQDHTPPDQVVASFAGRYILAGGKPVGIANTVSKYNENQPVLAHLTPFEQRVAAKLTEEQRLFDSSSEGGATGAAATAAALAAAAAAAGGDDAYRS